MAQIQPAQVSEVEERPGGHKVLIPSHISFIIHPEEPEKFRAPQMLARQAGGWGPALLLFPEKSGVK